MTGICGHRYMVAGELVAVCTRPIRDARHVHFPNVQDALDTGAARRVEMRLCYWDPSGRGHRTGWLPVPKT